MESRTPRTFVPATNVKKPKPRRASVNSSRISDRWNTNRPSVRTTRRANEIAQTQNSTVESAS